MEYVNVPEHISTNTIRENGYCFAPSKYSFFQPRDKKRYRTLSSLVHLREERSQVVNDKFYTYIEIGDINVNNGTIDYKKYLGVRIPHKSPTIIRNGDILISTVRTYRKGVAYVDLEEDNITCTPALLSLYDVDPVLTREYLFCILRSDFFIEQILSFQNRGMYPRLDQDTMEFVQIPLPRSEEEGAYISHLQASIFSKENEIKRKSQEILSLFINEMGISSEVSYAHPSLRDVFDAGRLDTGPYTDSFRKVRDAINNYKNGSSSLDELGYSITRGQNLQVSTIGRSVYSGSPQVGFYKLILSKNLSERMTIERFEYLGNSKQLKTVADGDIIFSCRGDLGRVFISCEDMKDTITNIDNVHIRNESGSRDNAIFIGAYLNYLRTIDYLKRISVQGSGADSFTKYHFDLIRIPNFNSHLQEKISMLYFNSHLKTNIATPEEFLENDSTWTAQAGIYQLSMVAQKIRGKLETIVGDIVNEKSSSLDFDFFN